MDMKLLANEVVVLWDQYNLHQWEFVLGKSKHRLGVCKHKLKVIEVSEIHARNDPANIVLDTLKHEIAHALVGPGHGHSDTWKAKAREVGCSEDACGSHSKHETYRAPGKWYAQCACGFEFQWYKKPKHMTGRYHVRCGKDKGKLEIKERN